VDEVSQMITAELLIEFFFYIPNIGPTAGPVILLLYSYADYLNKFVDLFFHHLVNQDGLGLAR